MIHWTSLGSVSPGFREWTDFPVPSIDDSVVRISFSSSNWLHIRSFVLLRSRWPNGEVSPASRIWPTREPQIVEVKIPEELAREGWVVRNFQIKRNYRDRRWGSQLDGSLSVLLEGGHYYLN